MIFRTYESGRAVQVEMRRVDVVRPHRQLAAIHAVTNGDFARAAGIHDPHFYALW